jgi:hypothetical protein
LLKGISSLLSFTKLELSSFLPFHTFLSRHWRQRMEMARKFYQKTFFFMLSLVSVSKNIQLSPFFLATVAQHTIKSISFYNFFILKFKCCAWTSDESRCRRLLQTLLLTRKLDNASEYLAWRSRPLFCRTPKKYHWC